MIYLDNNATTKVDPRVLKAMLPFFSEMYGNAASNHPFGVEVNQAVKSARQQLGSLINCDESEIIFTAGATESINVGLKGLAKSLASKGNHIITCATEHPAVLDTCKSLEKDGFTITYLPVTSQGLIDIEEYQKAFTPQTILVSIMLVNNETGIIQSIKQLAEIAHAKNTFFMTDATQAVGKMPVDVNELNVDMLVFSGHKFYGPKGIGGLYIRSRRPFKVKLEAIIHGGGHERGIRSGTLNVPGIVGLGQAAELCKDEMLEDAKRVEKLRNKIEAELISVGNASINGSTDNRIYNTTNICFKNTDADAIIAGLQEVMVSNGSACSSTKTEPSHVLTAMGLSSKDAYSSLRISLGRFTTEQEVKTAVSSIKNIIEKVRSMN